MENGLLLARIVGVPQGFATQKKKLRKFGTGEQKMADINETTIREIENKCMNNISIWEYRENSSMEKINIFNEGVRVMAQALIDAGREQSD